MDSSIDAFNDPKHIEVGAPDFTIRRKGHATDFPVGWIETKDIGEPEDLDKAEKSEQLQRYFGLHNVILTDYLEFRWYVDGKLRLDARLASSSGKRIRREREGERELLVLLHEFFAQSLATLFKPQELAERMAKLAHLIRDLLLHALETEPASGRLHNQFNAFREMLIPDLGPDQFSDMYAQTIAYGLFAARCQSTASSKDFSRAAAADLIPLTNPFLRRLFREIAFELDPRIQPFVNDLVALLRHAEIGKIMEDFGKRTAREDPVVHFYEDFLQEYDPEVREMRGVYYTPEPVVSYIVRSIDYLLRTKFDKPLGLADKDVLLLDFACGTGTFLYCAIRHIHQALQERGQLGQWNRYVSDNLLKRIFGFELLMAPYAVAHLKLGLLLQELGYKFESDERLGIYLTNTLEEAAKKAQQVFGFAESIAAESDAAAEIKRGKKIMVVLGNPPYSGFSANRGKWIEDLMKDYKVSVQSEERQIQRLSNDYVKFIRFAQWRLELTGRGILGCITDRGYLEGTLFRDMRKSLLKSFAELHVLDLHGTAMRGPARRTLDENVFDITQGVAVALFAKLSPDGKSPKMGYAELRGTREAKYKTLSESDIRGTAWRDWAPKAPEFRYVPEDSDPTYESWAALTDVMGTGNPKNDRDQYYGTGIKTRHDEFVIAWSPTEAVSKVERIAHRPETDDQLIQEFGLCTTAHFDIQSARNRAAAGDLAQYVRPIQYRPFDTRFFVYLRDFVCEPKAETMRHMSLDDNLAMAVLRRDRREAGAGFFVARGLIAKDMVSNLDDAIIWPLFVSKPLSRNEQSFGHLFDSEECRPNFSQTFIDGIGRKLQLQFTTDRRGNLKSSFGAEDLFDFIYAVFYSGSYRLRFAPFFKTNFPRVPTTSNRDLFAALARKGAELVSLHLLESPSVSRFITRYEKPGDHLVERISYLEPNPKAGVKSGRIYISPSQFFEGVPKNVWEFQIGGYQVCEKWLKDRKDRKLSSDDIDHYQKIIVALSETIRIMKEIDDLIPGWPLT